MFLLDQHRGGLNTLCLAYSPNDPFLLASGGTEELRMWDLRRRQTVWARMGADVNSLSFSPDGKQIVTSEAEHPSRIRLYDTQDGRLHNSMDRSYKVQCAVFSPDGEELASGGYERGGSNPLDRWDPRRGRLLESYYGHGSQIGFLAFSPDGQRILSGSADHTARLWDWNTGEQLEVFKHRSLVWGVAFSPDGKLMITTGGWVIQVWDSASLKRKVILRGHKKTVYGIAFSPDGRLLASASGDRTVRFWDLVSLRPLAIFNWEIGPIHNVAFSPDGLTAAAGSESGDIVVWDVDRG